MPRTVPPSLSWKSRRPCRLGGNSSSVSPVIRQIRRKGGRMLAGALKKRVWFGV